MSRSALRLRGGPPRRAGCCAEASAPRRRRARPQVDDWVPTGVTPPGGSPLTASENDLASLDKAPSLDSKAPADNNGGGDGAGAPANGHHVRFKAVNGARAHARPRLPAATPPCCAAELPTPQRGGRRPAPTLARCHSSASQPTPARARHSNALPQAA